MLRVSPSRLCGLAILFLPTTVQLIIQDTDSSIDYDSTWFVDNNGDNSDGSEHVCQTRGGVASHTFTGEHWILHRALRMISVVTLNS